MSGTIVTKRKTPPPITERCMLPKYLLQKARAANKDDLYTLYEDVEKELSMYDKDVWKNKTVYCNCDNPADDGRGNYSALATYLITNFMKLGLKKLICTYYCDTEALLNRECRGYVFKRTGFREIKKYPAGYDGSFDHPFSLKILKEEADIVCTNPPFSRAIDIWDIVINSGKNFLIISDITYPITSVFIPYFKNKQVWAGFNRVDYFLNPERNLVKSAGHWYTNIPIKDRPKYKQLRIISLKDIPEKYKKYDDSKILLVDNCYAPDDYKKPFAVSTRPILNGLLEKGYKIIQDKEYYPYVNGKKCFGRVLVQKI